MLLTCCLNVHCWKYLLALTVCRSSRNCDPNISSTASNSSSPTSNEEPTTMSKPRGLVVALVVLVAVCCLLCARCSIQGTILNKTLLQEAPGAGLSVLTTLYPTNVVEVLCRKSDVLVFDDPWWLQVIFVYTPTATTFTGWVADYDVNCGNAGNCDVPLC